MPAHMRASMSAGTALSSSGSAVAVWVKPGLHAAPVTEVRIGATKEPVIIGVLSLPQTLGQLGGPMRRLPALALFSGGRAQLQR